MPKSVSLIVISPVGGSCAELSRRRRPAGPPITIRFPGLTSRWMIPWRWAYSSPAQAWIPISVVVSAPRSSLGLQQLGHRLALDVLHHDVVAVGVDAGVVDLDDVRVDQLRHRERLAPEAGDELVVVGEVLGEDLDRHGALEHPVGGPVDRGHPARPEAVAELVAVGDRRGHRLPAAPPPVTPPLGGSEPPPSVGPPLGPPSGRRRRLGLLGRLVVRRLGRGRLLLRAGGGLLGGGGRDGLGGLGRRLIVGHARGAGLGARVRLLGELGRGCPPPPQARRRPRDRRRRAAPPPR